MKKILAKLLLISFIGISVFGMFSMIQSQEHGDMRGCIVEISRQGSCPQAMNNFDALIYHLEGFQKFTQSSLSGMFLFIFLIFIWRYIPTLPEKFKISVGIYLSPAPFYHRKKFSKWLSFLENSPSY